VETNSGSEGSLALLSPAEILSQLSTSSPENSSAYFGELIRRFEPVLRRTWRTVLSESNRDIGIEYDDFVHDTFIRVFEHLPDLRDNEAFPGYFRQITLSVAYDYFRRPRRELRHGDLRRDVEDIDTDQDPAPLGLLENIDEQILTGVLIQSYLNHLTAREQEVLNLEFFYGHSAQEIAKRIGLTPGGVRMIKSRALSKLRQIILREARASQKS
jgi:RNA polymerase sigma factor (sigma-70 family)